LHSSICGGQGVECIDLYMQDGDSPEMGHRRWIFANYLGPVGFGSAGTGYPSMTGSCFYQPAGSANAGMAFVAWPPPGEVPLQAIATTEADTAGWSIQSDSINLNAATATVTDGTTNRPVTVTALPENYGSTYAIRLLPNGWTSTAGHQYSVSVGGVSSSISYTVDVVDCATIDAGECAPSDGGPSAMDSGVASGVTDAGSSSDSGDVAIVDATTLGGPDGGGASTSSNDAGAIDTASSRGTSPGCSCDAVGSGHGPRRFAAAWTLAVAAMALGIARGRRRRS
jgi:hypothetical protein